MSTAHPNATEILRRGLLKIEPSTVLSAVDSLDLRASNKISAVVGVPLRALQQRRDVATFAQSAPIAAVNAMMEILASGPLDEVVKELGEHAGAPSLEQLSDAIDQLVTRGATSDDIVALLSFAIGEDFPASPHCRRLLEERSELKLPPLPDVAAPGRLVVPKEVDPEVRAQRRARRDAQKQQKKKVVSSPHPTRPAKVKRTPTVSPVVSEVTREVLASPAPARRRIPLTPAEATRFSAEHPLAGAVVLVEVPFSSIDPQLPEMQAKERPALVVAASESGVLVRGIYSSPFSDRSLFQPWRRLHLDHVCYLGDERIAIDTGVRKLEELGRLSDDEWNALH